MVGILLPMPEYAKTIAEWIERLRLLELGAASAKAGLVFFAASALVFLVELRHGTNRARFRSKAFFNDVLYSLFYRGGVYTVLLWVVVVNAFEAKLDFLRLNWLADLPAAASIAVYWVVGDFLLYWLHRAQHSVPLLWAFHSVHHAEQEISTLSQNRRHPLEAVTNGLVLYIPLAFVLGLPTRFWLPLYVVAQMFEAMQHAELRWTLGPLYRLIVSPVFHSQHHSDDPKRYNCNYGAMLSVWDHLLGTASPDRERPPRYGIRGFSMPESIPAQLAAPFKMLLQSKTTDQAAERASGS